MKNLIYFLLFCIPVFCTGQCPQDTVSLDNPAGNFLWSVGEPYNSPCPIPCDNANRYNCWTLPYSGIQGFEGLMQFASSDSIPTLISCRLVADCHILLWDTCATLSLPITGIFNMYGEVPILTQACMYWDSTETDSVMFYCKPTALQHRLYDIPLMDLDTCGQLVYVESPVSFPKTYQRLTELLMGQNPEKIPLEKMLPGIIYLESDTKRKMMIHE